MKVQCYCGAKYAIDVTPEMARDPVRFICPACNTDLSGPINELVRQELGLAEPAAPTPASATASPPTARVRIASESPKETVAAPAKLTLSRSASAATHGAPVEAPQTSGDPGEPQPCPKHKGELTVERCYVCRKPICPKCMELFGFVCSPLCRARAESTGIHVPVFHGQKSVRDAREWRKTGRIGTAIGAAVILLLGVWIWYAWYGSVLHPVFTVRFPDAAYSGKSFLTGKNQIVFLHGSSLARYDLGSPKKAAWTTEIITKQQLDDAIEQQKKRYVDVLNEAIRRGSDFRPHPPPDNEIAKEVQQALESSLQLFVQGQNIWVAHDGKLTRYDWETGKPGQGIALPNRYEEPSVDGSELLFADENGFGQQIITHINLASGETRTEEIGEPKTSATLATAAKKAGAKNKQGAEGAGLPNNPADDSNRPLDPTKVARDAQNLPYAAKIALPATLSNARHQQEIMNEINEDEGRGQPQAAAAAAKTRLDDSRLSNRSFLNSKYGPIEWSSKVLEQKSVAHQAMKDKPARSALESNPSVTNTAAIANEILNDMQRDRGGGTVVEDVSRYQVTVHQPGAKDVQDWIGEVIGPPAVIPQKTVTVVTGGKMLIVLDKSNKKLWQSDLTYNIGSASSFEDADPAEPSLGQGPCVEHGDTLYVFDQAALTAFDISNGNVRWRVPTIGIVGLFFDDQGTVYVNSSTADLESLKFSRQIDITKKINAAVLRIDCKTGNVLWNTQPGGFVSHVDGKFVFCFASHQAPDDFDPDSITTMPGTLGSVMDIRRLSPKNGKIVWDYGERACPFSVRFKDNIVELIFRQKVEVLKFLTL